MVIERAALTVHVTPEVHATLALLAMGGTPERCAADVLDRWRRQRTGPHTGLMRFITAGTRHDGPDPAACTVALDVACHAATFQALAEHRHEQISTERFAALLVSRWAQWHREVAANPLGIRRANDPADPASNPPTSE